MAEQRLDVEDLWRDFHGVVNMTAPELRDWLGSSVVPHPGDRPDAVPPLGAAVAEILAKRKTDLTRDDTTAMRKVIGVFEEETQGRSPQEVADNERARHRLMNVGHDPVKRLRSGPPD